MHPATDLPHTALEVRNDAAGLETRGRTLVKGSDAHYPDDHEVHLQDRVPGREDRFGLDVFLYHPVEVGHQHVLHAPAPQFGQDGEPVLSALSGVQIHSQTGFLSLEVFTQLILHSPENGKRPLPPSLPVMPP